MDNQEIGWITFPGAVGVHHAQITCDVGFAAVAKDDHRDNHLGVRVAFKNPTEQGMPQDPSEFRALEQISDRLEEVIACAGGIYVGRITTDGHRYFYFYTAQAEGEARATVQSVSGDFGYRVDISWEYDPERSEYFNDLFPTLDDRQVVMDMATLEALRETGDSVAKEREVFHCVCFGHERNVLEFEAWLEHGNYRIIEKGWLDEGAEFQIRFSHIGSMVLEDITYYSINIGRTARELSGEYAGWESGVVPSAAHYHTSNPG